MIRIDLIYIIKVCCCSLISKIDRVSKRNIPDREGLEFCISGLDSELIILVKL